MDFTVLLSILATIARYAPSAVKATNEIVDIWEEDTGNKVTYAQWDEINAILRTPESYFKD